MVETTCCFWKHKAETHTLSVGKDSFQGRTEWDLGGPWEACYGTSPANNLGFMPWLSLQPLMRLTTQVGQLPDGVSTKFLAACIFTPGPTASRTRTGAACHVNLCYTCGATPDITECNQKCPQRKEAEHKIRGFFLTQAVYF